MQKENIQRVNDLIDDTIDLDEYEKEFGELNAKQAIEEASSSDDDMLEEHKRITESDRKQIIQDAFGYPLKRVDRVEDFKPKLSYAKIGKKLGMWSSIV